LENLSSLIVLMSLFAQAAPVVPVTFDAEPVVTRSADGSLTLEVPPSEIVVARIKADGRRIIGCVDSESAARALMTAPEAKLPRNRTDSQ
jgi:hypothetical protein